MNDCLPKTLSMFRETVLTILISTELSSYWSPIALDQRYRHCPPLKLPLLVFEKCLSTCYQVLTKVLWQKCHDTSLCGWRKQDSSNNINKKIHRKPFQDNDGTWNDRDLWTLTCARLGIAIFKLHVRSKETSIHLVNTKLHQLMNPQVCGHADIGITEMAHQMTVDSHILFEKGALWHQQSEA